MSNNPVDHPYFTRCKGPADSLFRQGKRVIREKNKEVSLTDVVVAQPNIEDHNELIKQLMQ